MINCSALTEWNVLHASKVLTILLFADPLCLTLQVTDAKAQTGLILGELKALMKTQMRTIPSLSPYSSDEIVDMIVYGILGLPALLLLSFCGLCCCTRKQNKQPTGDAEEVNASSIRKPGSAGKRKGNKGSKK